MSCLHSCVFRSCLAQREGEQQLPTIRRSHKKRITLAAHLHQTSQIQCQLNFPPKIYDIPSFSLHSPSSNTFIQLPQFAKSTNHPHRSLYSRIQPIDQGNFQNQSTSHKVSSAERSRGKYHGPLLAMAVDCGLMTSQKERYLQPKVDLQKDEQTIETLSKQECDLALLKGVSHANHWRILKLLKNSLMCIDEMNGCIFAFKLAIKIKSNSPTRQAEQMAKLFAKHPRLVSIYLCIAFQKNLFFIMEPTTHGSLFQMLQLKIFSEELAKKCLLQVIEALTFLHQNQFVHGCLNAKNVLLSFNQYKVLAPEIGCGIGRKLSRDIEDLAFLAFQMTNGLFEDNYQQLRNSRDVRIRTEMICILKESIEKEGNANLSGDLKSFIQMLLNHPDSKLTLYECLNQAFFRNNQNQNHQ